MMCELNSWTTGEEYGNQILNNRNGITQNETNGWTVCLQDENDSYELMGYDYVYDLISEMEIAPAFPVCKSYFLVSSDKSNDASASCQRRMNLTSKYE